MMLQTVIIGSGGSAPPPGYGGPSILVNTGSTSLLLDCGENCVSTLGKLGINPCKIDYVYISHIHIDHWAGLPSFAVKLIEKGCHRLTIITHKEVSALLNNYLSEFMPSRLGYEMEVVDNDQIDIGEYFGTLFKTFHKVPTYGMVISDKKSGKAQLVYTSDTGYTESIKNVIPHSPRVLIADTTLPTQMAEVAAITGHMTVSQVIRLSGDLNPGLTVAFHLSELSLEELVKTGPNGLIIPRDGMILNV
jgi:ribonuclease Z